MATRPRYTLNAEPQTNGCDENGKEEKVKDWLSVGVRLLIWQCGRRPGAMCPEWKSNDVILWLHDTRPAPDSTAATC